MTLTDQELEQVARETAETLRWLRDEKGKLERVTEIILSALKQVQPTRISPIAQVVLEAIKGDLVDSIAVSPQEQQGAVSNINADRGCPCLYTTPCRPDCTCVCRGMSCGCSRCCSYGSLEQKTRWAKRLASIIDSGLQAPPPASTPANPPKEGRADAEGETNWGDAIDELGFIGSGSCVPNIDTQRGKKN